MSKISVEFVNESMLEATEADFPTVRNTGKPFELDERVANVYIECGILKSAAKPKTDKKEGEK